MLIGQVLGQRGQRQPGGQVMHPQRAEHGLGHQQRVTDRGQRDQPGAAGEPASHVGGRAQRQPGLAGAAAAGQGHQPGGGQQALDLAQLAPASDEAGQLGRQAGRPGLAGAIHLRGQGTPHKPAAEGTSERVRPGVVAST